jgi:poly-gamma-glutamate capsule biosynthesis protein CapA/YwtB (metallophosphatase superfamily)
MKHLLEQIKRGAIEFSQNENNQKGIDVIIAGDLCPDRRLEKMAAEDNVESIYNDVLDELKKKDLSIVNLECPLTNKTHPIDKQGSNLIADPKTIKIVSYGCFDVVTLANNHVLDQGRQGLLDTIQHCNGAGIKTVGAGGNIQEASRFLTVTVEETSIAILNFAEIEFSIAEENRAGANPLNPIKNYYQILEAKKKADIVLVIVHGGVERSRLPSPDFAETLRFFADFGVSAVIAHHTHCAGGVEIYNNVPIFYSLGNFLFDRDYKYSHWFESFFIRLSLADKKIRKIELIPYYQFKNGIGVKLMHGTDRHAFLNDIAELSGIIKNPDLLNENWFNLCSEKRTRYLSIACSLNKLEKKMLKLKIGTSIFFRKEKLLMLLSMYRCQSHREVMIRVLENELRSN